MRVAWRVILLAGFAVAPLGAAATATGDTASAPTSEPASTQASEPTTNPTAIDPALEAQLEALDKKNSSIVDLTSHYEQRRYTDLSPRPFVSSGTLRAMKSIARWDNTEPKPSVMIITPREVQMYYPSEKLLEEYPVDPGMMDMLSTPFPQLAVYRRHFSIMRADAKAMDDNDPAHSGDLVLALIPFDPTWTQHVQMILVRVNLQTGLTQAMRTVDADRQATDMIFSDTKVNTGLKVASLLLTIPLDTKISRPLGNKPDNSPAGGQ